MRLAPCAICFPNNLEKTLQICELSSFTTHNGLEAADCCRLLGFIIHKGINSLEKGKPLKLKILNNLWNDFWNSTKKMCLPSIEYLAKSEIEPKENLSNYPKQFN
jgi:ADP-ribosylglycohydrolase